MNFCITFEILGQIFYFREIKLKSADAPFKELFHIFKAVSCENI